MPAEAPSKLSPRVTAWVDELTWSNLTRVAPRIRDLLQRGGRPDGSISEALLNDLNCLYVYTGNRADPDEWLIFYYVATDGTVIFLSVHASDQDALEEQIAQALEAKQACIERTDNPDSIW